MQNNRDRSRSPIVKFKNNNTKMAEITQIEMNMARDMIPQYSGGSKNLAYFLNQVDNYLSFLRQKEDCLFNRLLLEQVKSKITGEARDVLINSQHNKWSEIKETLTQKFGDPRSEELLLHDLTTTFQKYHQSYEEYHEIIKRKLQILLEHVSVRESNRDIRNCKENSYQNQALSTFKAGLLEPYCRHLMNMNVISLEQALFECRKFDNDKAQVNFMKFIRNQNNNDNYNTKNTNSNRRPNYNRFQPRNHNKFIPHNNNYPTNNQANQIQNSRKSLSQIESRPFPSEPIALEFRQTPPTNFPTRSQVFGRTENRPIPMSINTRNTNRNTQRSRQTNYFTPRSHPTFTTEELFNVETDEDQNFQTIATQNQYG